MGASPSAPHQRISGPLGDEVGEGWNVLSLLEMAWRRGQAAASVSILQVMWTAASLGLRAIEIQPTLFTEQV